MTLRHDKLRDNIADLLQEVTNDVRLEPTLQPLTGEEQSLGGKVSVEARADISPRGFWFLGQRAFFDVRVSDPNAQRHGNKTLKRCYELGEHEKKRDFTCRILNVEQGSFTSAFFFIAGGMGRKCAMFVKRFCQMISLMRQEELSVVT